VPELAGVPALREPVLVAAFEGWNDAGEAASAAIAHLVQVWDARLVGEFDPEDYYDFQVNRPRVSLVDGRRIITWPTTRIHVCLDSSGTHDVVLIEGIEPSTRWRSFTAELVQVARDLGVETVVSLGAFLADVPHTRPIPVNISSDDLSAQLTFGAEPSDYQGPTGIVGVLTEALRAAGIQAVSCWAAVPHYAGGPPSPKATLALLDALAEILDVSIPAQALADDARTWERGVDEMAENDDEVADYVQSLEEASDTADMPEASGDAIAREFERYLRGHEDDSS